MASNYNYSPYYTFSSLATFILWPNHHSIIFSSLTTLLKLDFANIISTGSHWKITSVLLNPVVSFLSLYLLGVQKHLIWFITIFPLQHSLQLVSVNFNVFILVLDDYAQFEISWHFSFHILFCLGMPQGSVFQLYSLIIICYLMVSNDI